MMLRIENIGIIEKSNVEINGLTVITGNNDSGKSTVGKIAYSLTKSFEDFERNYEQDKAVLLKKYFIEFYRALRESVDFNKYPELRTIMEEFLSYRETDYKKSLELIENSLKLLDVIDIDKEKKDEIQKLYDEINHYIFPDKETIHSKIIKSIQRIFKSEFSNQITNVFADEGRIYVYEGENKLINIIIKDNKPHIGEPEIDEIFPFSSSIFIETPHVLDYKRYLDIRKEDLQSPEIYHIKDLLFKLTRYGLNKEKTDFLKISEIINGEVYFDDDNNDFFFKKFIGNKKVTIQMLNTASGIKSFGILQILENAGEFNKNKNLLLIINEPEVHLHPYWQIEYARILIKLVENGVNVLVTSHSPYLIMAIDEYSKKSEIRKNVKFYLSELTNNGNALIVDKTNDKNEIFNKLSKPLENLVFG